MNAEKDFWKLTGGTFNDLSQAEGVRCACGSPLQIFVDEEDGVEVFGADRTCGVCRAKAWENRVKSAVPLVRPRKINFEDADDYEFEKRRFIMTKRGGKLPAKYRNRCHCGARSLNEKGTIPWCESCRLIHRKNRLTDYAEQRLVVEGGRMAAIWGLSEYFINLCGAVKGISSPSQTPDTAHKRA